MGRSCVRVDSSATSGWAEKTFGYATQKVETQIMRSQLRRDHLITIRTDSGTQVVESEGWFSSVADAIPIDMSCLLNLVFIAEASWSFEKCTTS